MYSMYAGGHGQVSEVCTPVSDIRFVVHTQQVHASGLDDVKLRVFLDACQNFQPVMRHFLLERYPQPADWYQHRLNYTRSVAASSIGMLYCLVQRRYISTAHILYTAAQLHLYTALTKVSVNLCCSGLYCGAG